MFSDEIHALESLSHNEDESEAVLRLAGKQGNLILRPWFGKISVKMIACGDAHSAIVTKNGKLFTFGKGDFGKLGHGNLTKLDQPTEIQGLSDVTLVACGFSHTIAATAAGRLFGFGCNQDGQLCNGNDEESMVPVDIDVKGPFIEVSCGHEHSAVLCDSGTVYMWGGNSEGQIGNGNVKNAVKPFKIAIKNDKVRGVACGNYHTAIVTHKGDVYTWGNAEDGKLGVGDIKQELVKKPQKVKLGGNIKAVAVACGTAHTMLLTSGHTLFACGENASGQLGIPDIEQGCNTFTKLPWFSNAVRAPKHIACGEKHTAVCLADGRVVSFGQGNHGKLGHVGSTEDIFEPTIVESLEGVFSAAKVACGGTFSIFVGTHIVENVLDRTRAHVTDVAANIDTQTTTTVNTTQGNVKKEIKTMAPIKRNLGMTAGSGTLRPLSSKFNLQPAQGLQQTLRGSADIKTNLIPNTNTNTLSPPSPSTTPIPRSRAKDSFTNGTIKHNVDNTTNVNNNATTTTTTSSSLLLDATKFELVSDSDSDADSDAGVELKSSTTPATPIDSPVRLRGKSLKPLTDKRKAWRQSKLSPESLSPDSVLPDLMIKNNFDVPKLASLDSSPSQVATVERSFLNTRADFRGKQKENRRSGFDSDPESDIEPITIANNDTKHSHIEPVHQSKTEGDANTDHTDDSDDDDDDDDDYDDDDDDDDSTDDDDDDDADHNNTNGIKTVEEGGGKRDSHNEQEQDTNNANVKDIVEDLDPQKDETHPTQPPQKVHMSVCRPGFFKSRRKSKGTTQGKGASTTPTPPTDDNNHTENLDELSTTPTPIINTTTDTDTDIAPVETTGANTDDTTKVVVAKKNATKHNKPTAKSCVVS